jgi:hypothetical protein
MMSDKSFKGKIGPDGETRYYNSSKHVWQTQYEIDQENKAQNAVNLLVIIATLILGGGGFLWMLVTTLTS